jgi:hypothetical protein
VWWDLPVTPERSEHRDAVDVARVLALLIVVVGHLTLAVIDRTDGSVRGANLLALHPEWAWVAAAAPMPIFFAAAGWANAGATLITGARRLRTLVGVAAVVVGSWSCAVAMAIAVAGAPGVVGDGARIATQPTWFLAAYLPFAAAGRPLARAAARQPVAVIGGSLAALAALDLARFGLGAPDWIGWPGFFLAWGVPWLAGGWWRDRAATGLREQPIGLVLAMTATAAAVVLVRTAGYAPSLIDAVEGARSNTTPPTLYTAVVGLAQVGVLLTVARGLDAAGRRWRRLWARAGEAAVGVYLWHLSALALCGGAVALGLPVPERLTTAWWLTRPLWWGAVVAVSVGFVTATAAVRTWMQGRDGTPGAGPSAPRAVAGIVLAATGAAAVGLRGPRTGLAALACSALFVAGWVALRGRRSRPGSPPTGSSFP